MYKFRIKLLYNKEKIFGFKTELLSFTRTLPLAKLFMVEARLASIDLIFTWVILYVISS